jgi:hypothetical protein
MQCELIKQIPNFIELIHLFLPIMKRFVILLLLISSFSTVLNAQRKMQELDEEEAKKEQELKKYESNKKGFDKDKLSLGGNVGASFANGGMFIMLQPMVGYYVLPKTMAGVGATYIYQSYTVNTATGTKKYSSNIYGPILFARQQLLPSLFLHGEYQPINYSRFNSIANKEERHWVNQLFVGGGYGGRSGGFIFVLYDVLWDQNTSIYGSPWAIRMGFML